MDKATRKDNRRRDYRRQMKGAAKNQMAAMMLSVRQTIGAPEITARRLVADPIFIPTRSQVVKRKRMEVHLNRCKR